LCYSCVPQVKRDKLDKRAELRIFISYSTISKAYSIFQPKTGKILKSRGMHFTEDEKWCRSDSKKKQIVALEVKDRVDDTPVRGQGCFLTSTREAMQKSAI